MGDVFQVWNYHDIASELEVTASVYKAELPDGKVVALKKLHQSEREDSAFVVYSPQYDIGTL
ncbi:hypothetical protein CUMW_196230 [Citrus unshiu]|nr:hypothetical protein CUMW_196230 [Citrus unshiu]